MALTTVPKASTSIYDLGGGTFDVSLLRLTKRRIRGSCHGRQFGLWGATTSIIGSCAGPLKSSAAASGGCTVTEFLSGPDKRVLTLAVKAAREALTNADEVEVTKADLSDGRKLREVSSTRAGIRRDERAPRAKDDRCGAKTF